MSWLSVRLGGSVMSLLFWYFAVWLDLGGRVVLDEGVGVGVGDFPRK